MTGCETRMNSYRVSETDANDNFGLVEIDWDPNPAPMIMLKLIAMDGSTVFGHKISQGSLRPAK